MNSFEERLEKADRLDAITQKVGFAVWQLQELEDVAALYFVLLVQAPKGMGLEAGNDLVEKAQGRTFGATIRQIAKAGLLDSELKSRFFDLLSERNWLVHESRASSRSAVHNDATAEKLILRLDAIADETLALLRALGALVESNTVSLGVPEQYIHEEAYKLLEQWHTSDEF